MIETDTTTLRARRDELRCRLSRARAKGATQRQRDLERDLHRVTTAILAREAGLSPRQKERLLRIAEEEQASSE